MTEPKDSLLTQLGKVARDRQSRQTADEVFERLARGELSPAELATLEREAAHDAELALKLSLYRPLASPFVERVLGQTQVPRSRAAPSIVRRVAFAAAATVLLAAGAAWFFRLETRAPLEVLPAYSMVLEGERPTRGDGPAAVATFGPGSRLRLLIRPATSVTSDVAVSFFIAQRDGLRAWLPPVERSAGSLRIDAPIEQLLPPAAGEFRILVVLGGHGAVTVDDAARWEAAGPPPGLQLLQARGVQVTR